MKPRVRNISYLPLQKNIRRRNNVRDNREIMINGLYGKKIKKITFIPGQIYLL